MRLLIWGAGAIGGTIGAYLVRSGHDVSFVDVAADHVAAINDRGLSIEGPIDQFTVPAKAFTPEQLSGTWQTILLCTKGQHTEQATQVLLPHLAPDGYVVSVQNGLNEMLIAEMVGQERTVGCFVNFGADYHEAGQIHYGGRGAVVLGELDGSSSERLRALHQTFVDFDRDAIISPNIWGYLWGKMAYGALLYATALTNESIADVLAMPAYQALLIAIGKEVLAVAEAQAVSPEGFNGFDPQAFGKAASQQAALNSLQAMIAFNRKSAKSHSGIWRDLAVRKRKTEVDAHLGMIVRVGQEAGLATPLLARLLALIQRIERGEAELSLENLEDLKGLYENSL